MATVSKWNPFGVSLNITAEADKSVETAGVKRISATEFTVKINASWEVYYSGAKTNYGMEASSGKTTHTISSFNGSTYRSSGSGSFTGTYSISGNGSATKTITVTFRNFKTDNNKSATKSVSFNVVVPAWDSYTVTYNANGGSGAPSKQTKWKGQALTISSTKPTKSGYTFVCWSTSPSATENSTSDKKYDPGDSFTTDNTTTLYAIWKKTLTITYNANGGTNTPSKQEAIIYNSTTSATFTLRSVGSMTKSGYTFKGWAKTSTAKTSEYSAGASVSISSNLTLYAVWETSYVAPKISNLTVKRCTSDGTELDDGTYAKVSFSWTTFATKPTITASWKLSGGTTTLGSSSLTASGTKSGTVSAVVGGGALSIESHYVITVTVDDATQAVSKSATVSGDEFPIEVVRDNNGKFGVGIGKKAEVAGYLDVAYSTRLRSNLRLMKNATSFYGTDPDDGSSVVGFTPQNANGNTVVGGGNYDRKKGSTHICGYDLFFYVSNQPSPGYYKPYHSKGDSFTITFRGTGYIRTNIKEVTFWIPLSKPIIGTPTVTLASTDGFMLRQDGKLTHGSSVGYVFPTSMTVTLDGRSSAPPSSKSGLCVVAAFEDSTNAILNDLVAVYWSGTITFT